MRILVFLLLLLGLTSASRERPDDGGSDSLPEGMRTYRGLPVRRAEEETGPKEGLGRRELPLDQLRVAVLGERSAADVEGEKVERSLDYKDMLRKIKEHLKKNVDPELLKREIEKIFDQGTEILRMLLRTLKEKGRRKLEILVDALLDDDDRDSRSIQDYWQKVKDYFKDLKIDLKEKYMRFGEWVKNAYDRGLERSKDKMENIKAIAKEFAKHAKNVSKEVGAEASDFFRQYKEDLGNVWDELKEAFKQIRNRED